MLGWELPPFNSGGLGTACLGLTQGLSDCDINIRFVVPKVFGKYPFKHMELVSAADYSNDHALQKLLNQEGAHPEMLLAYGAQARNHDGHITVDHLTSTQPISPTVQAKWYAEQATAIAEEQENFDVIHAHDWFTYYGGMAARKVARAQGRTVPFIAHVHATELDRAGRHPNPAILSIEKKGLRAADHIIAVSNYTKDLLHRAYKIPYKKISVVHNGIPAKTKPHYSDLHAFKKDHKIVLFIGRLTMQKGPDYFVKLAKAVTDANPSIRFIMVGSGDMEQHCIEEAARQGLTGKMLFSSFLRGTDVDRAYQMADIFVMPSVSEPFGIVALEAMQNGTPVLVSRHSGVAEVSEHVIVTDFWDIPTMQKAVIRTLEDAEYATKLRKGSFQDLKHLTWKQAATNVKTIYTQVVTPTPQPSALLA